MNTMRLAHGLALSEEELGDEAPERTGRSASFFAGLAAYCSDRRIRELAARLADATGNSNL